MLRSRRSSTAVTYTITELAFRFSVAGSFEEPERTEHVSAAEVNGRAAHTDSLGYAGALAPGTGLRVASVLLDIADAETAIAVVRWTDRWKQL
jgi:hypothetical protein